MESRQTVDLKPCSVHEVCWEPTPFPGGTSVPGNLDELQVKRNSAFHLHLRRLHGTGSAQSSCWAR